MRARREEDQEEEDYIFKPAKSLHFQNDAGREGVSYSDTTPGNLGGSAYRSDDVDITEYKGGTTNVPPVYTVNQLATGEWLEYTIDVPQTANYRIVVRLRNPSSDVLQTFLQVQIGPDGGPYEFDSGSVGMTTANNWRYGMLSSGADLSAGRKVMRLTVVEQGSLLEIDHVAIVLLDGTQTPYPDGTPHAIPGVIEPENFDIGGPNISYYDTTSPAQMGTAPDNKNFRATEVDTVVLKTEGIVVAWITTGEWLEYTVDVAKAGLYEVLIRYATVDATKQIDITLPEQGDISIFGGVRTLPWAIGGLNDYATVPFLANLSAGQQVLRLKIVTGGNLNLSRIEFKKAYGDSVTDDVGFWRFDLDGKNPADTAGTVTDLSAHGNDGSGVNGPVYLAEVPPVKADGVGVTLPTHTHHGGYLNQRSLRLQRVDSQYIRVPHAESLSLGDSSFSVSAWFQAGTIPGGTTGYESQRQWLLCKKSGSSDDSGIDYAVLAGAADLALNPTFSNYNSDPTVPYTPDGREIVLVFGNGSGVQTVASRLKISNTNWHRIEISYDAVKKEIIFLLDGGKGGERVAGVNRSASSTNTGDLLIGAHVNSGGVVDQFIDGVIDEVRITPRPFTGSPTNTAWLGTTWYWENDGSATPDGMFTVQGKRPFAMNRGQMYNWNRCFWDVFEIPGEPGNLALRWVDADEAIPTGGPPQSNCMKWDNDGGDAGSEATPNRISDGVTFQARFKLVKFISNRDNIFDDWEGRAKFLWFVTDLTSFPAYTVNAQFAWSISYADEAARTGIALWAKEKNVDTDGDGTYDQRWHSDNLNDDRWHTLHAVAYASGGKLRRKTWLDDVLVEDFESRAYTVPGMSFGLNDHYDPNMWTVETHIDYFRMSGVGAWDPWGHLLWWPEICDNEADDDDDGLVDCLDPECFIPCCPNPVFDADKDSDVDQADFAVLQACFTDSGDPLGIFESLPDVCRCMDVLRPGSDNDLDRDDYDAFELCASGPGIRANAACDD